MKIQNDRPHTLPAILSILLGTIALYASLRGIIDASLYHEIYASQALIWGSRAQDIISAPLSVILLICAVMNLLKPSFYKITLMLGLIWYFLYAYGLYVIQGAYTSIYYLYLMIFSLAVYTLIFGLISSRTYGSTSYTLGKKLRFGIIAFCVLILIVLIPAWAGKMIGDIARRQPGETYAVYIMDLGIVFPAMIITVVLLIKKHAFGIILSGLVLLKTFTLCLSWTFAEWTVPFIGQPVAIDMAGISSILCIVGLLLFIIYSRAIISHEYTR